MSSVLPSSGGGYENSKRSTNYRAFRSLYVRLLRRPIRGFLYLTIMLCYVLVRMRRIFVSSYLSKHFTILRHAHNVWNGHVMMCSVHDIGMKSSIGMFVLYQISTHQTKPMGETHTTESPQNYYISSITTNIIIV